MRPPAMPTIATLDSPPPVSTEVKVAVALSDPRLAVTEIVPAPLAVTVVVAPEPGLTVPGPDTVHVTAAALTTFP